MINFQIAKFTYLNTDRVLGSKGFSLLEMVTAAGLASILILTISALWIYSLKSANTIQEKLDLNESKIEFRNLMLGTCSQYNTLYYSENSTASCIPNKTCQPNQSGPLTLVDEQGHVSNYPNRTRYNERFVKCDENNSNQCEYLIDSKFEVVCSNEVCEDPNIKINLKMYKYSQDLSTRDQIVDDDSSIDISAFELIINPIRVYTSCMQAFEQGVQANGVYHIDTDGVGGKCPIPVYCKFNLNGAQGILPVALLKI